MPRFRTNNEILDAVERYASSESFGRYPSDDACDRYEARIRRESNHAQAIYGAYVFLLLHWRTPRESRKAARIQRIIDPHIAGCAVGVWPEAARVYAKLCNVHNVEPEATL